MCPDGFGTVPGSIKNRGGGSIRNYYPGMDGYFVFAPQANPQSANKELQASAETCANFCKKNTECCSFQYGPRRFGFLLCLMLTFSSPGSAF